MVVCFVLQRSFSFKKHEKQEKKSRMIHGRYLVGPLKFTMLQRDGKLSLQDTDFHLVPMHMHGKIADNPKMLPRTTTKGSH